MSCWHHIEIESGYEASLVICREAVPSCNSCYLCVPPLCPSGVTRAKKLLLSDKLCCDTWNFLESMKISVEHWEVTGSRKTGHYAWACLLGLDLKKVKQDFPQLWLNLPLYFSLTNNTFASLRWRQTTRRLEPSLVKDLVLTPQTTPHHLLGKLTSFIRQ